MGGTCARIQIQAVCQQLERIKDTGHGNFHALASLESLIDHE